MPAHAMSLSECPGIIVELATSRAAIREAQALRHQVFCLERRLFPEHFQQLDQDDFDRRARHILIRRENSGDVIATARVVAGRNSAEHSLPMQRYCCASVFKGLSMCTIGEISRFAISKQARQVFSLGGPHLRLALLQGVVQVSEEGGLTHWCALMEPSLIRLLADTGIHFVPVGPKVEAYGQRQPCIARIDRAIATALRSHPHYYTRVVRGDFMRAA